ncbi:hypothetical protein V8F33_009657 [Rhypophila sp. PSN 637]
MTPRFCKADCWGCLIVSLVLLLSLTLTGGRHNMNTTHRKMRQRSESLISVLNQQHPEQKPWSSYNLKLSHAKKGPLPCSLALLYCSARYRQVPSRPGCS